jgi:radical SAM superfamily enzyme with C-terminal helix-hairpin-helix motif
MVVTGHRERSLEALPLPVNINALPQKGLEFIPGVSKKTAPEIILKRPFKSIENFKDFVKEREIDIPAKILRHCETL